MRKRAAIEFSLCWKSRFACHNDRTYIEKVDFWRDIFPGSMGNAVAQLDAGQSHTETFDPGELVPPWDSNNLITVKTSQTGAGGGKQNLELKPGRYYPKGYFWKPLGAFPADQTPVRVAGMDDPSVLIDTNHPLARYPLQVKATIHERSTISAQRGGSLNHIAEMITTGGTGMQAPVDGIRFTLSDGSPLAREDETDDLDYYRAPRLVHHLDAAARSQVRSMYGRLLKNNSRVLDLMSSWQSHIPESLNSCQVEGLGLNEQELQANGRLSNYLLHDLNKNPCLPYADNSFDAAICTVSIEYLCRPHEVLSELARILVAGGTLALTVSERWFPGKQVAGWADLHPFERQGAVLSYLIDQGSFTAIHTESVRGYPRPAEDRYAAQLSHSDSLYFLWAECAK